MRIGNILLAIAGIGLASVSFSATVECGDRLQVMWDDWIVDTNKTTAVRQLHQPTYAGVAMLHDDAWEGDASSWHNIVVDSDEKGTLYRMYYLGWDCVKDIIKSRDPNNEKTYQICYAESRDGVTWVKPNLGLFTYNGSKANNIILDRSCGDITRWGGVLSVFKDENPVCPPDERYKGLTGGAGLNCYVSADGIHFRFGWTLFKNEGRRVMFDTMCNAIWDRRTSLYHVYVRGNRKVPKDERDLMWNDGEMRQIVHATSKDFRTWTPRNPVEYDSPDGPTFEYPMYSNDAVAYDRNPDLFVAFPTRYNERCKWTANYDALPDPENRKVRCKVERRMGLAITDCLFMMSRDGHRFLRYDDAFMRPGPERTTGWVYGSCYPARGLVRTKSPIGAADELSFYVPTGQFFERPPVLERYVLRQDGFVSRHAGFRGARVVTKQFRFSGDTMLVNFSTSGRGQMRIIMYSKALKDPLVSAWMFGDQVDRPVPFPAGGLSAVSGQSVTVDFRMFDADLYSFRFTKGDAP